MAAAVSSPGELEPIETASVDELRALQLERLRWSLRHAYDNVPYYRKMFDVAAVHPDDVKDLSDLARFPFTTKASLRDNYPFGMFAVPREQVALPAPAHPQRPIPDGAHPPRRRRQPGGCSLRRRSRSRSGRRRGRTGR